MENPYQILRRFINWEIMDLEAMIETISNRGAIEKKNDQTMKDNQNHQKQLNKFQSKNSIFLSKDKKINKITELNNKIEVEEIELEASKQLNDIVHLYLH